MKYVILIHDNPGPWGHPTGHFTQEGRQLDSDQRAAMDRKFEDLMKVMSASGELAVAEALAAPAAATIYRWQGDTPVATDGPYAETKEQLAGFFLVDVESRQRAEEIAEAFAHPGDVIEPPPGDGARRPASGRPRACPATRGRGWSASGRATSSTACGPMMLVPAEKSGPPARHPRSSSSPTATRRPMATTPSP